MPKVENMGVSPSQVNFQTGNQSCAKQSTSEQTHASAECAHGEPLEENHQLCSEIVRNEQGETSALVSNDVKENVQSFSEDVKDNSSEHLELPEHTRNSSLTHRHGDGVCNGLGAVSAHGNPSEQGPQFTSEIIQNKQGETSAVVSSSYVSETLQSLSEDVAKNSLTEHLGLSPGDVNKGSQTYKRSPQQTSPKQAHGLSAHGAPSETMRVSELGQTELFEASTMSSYIANQSGSPPELVTKRPPAEDVIKIPNSEQLNPSTQDGNGNSSFEQLQTERKNLTNNSSPLGNKDKRTSKSLKKRSLIGSDRVLRPRSQEKPKSPEASSSLPNVNSGRGKQKRNSKNRRSKEQVANEYSRIRTHVRNSLQRMKYEQSLIDAYSAEGWKGLSLEKLKPEKELQRASSEILRRKSKIRDLFQCLDALCAEGQFPDSLFDSDGQISSEDIFCAKCGSTDLSADNDIILCDGACDRGFHQFCLEPPLFTDDIPPDDEGWLCPGCDCKVDCIDLLNDSQGTNLSVIDPWEKVFPEASTGKNQDPNFGLPSDDSDDCDYDPDELEVDEKDQGDESSSDESDQGDEPSSESDFTSASDELEVPPNDEQFLGLPSDDSEDDDYDPNAPDPNEKAKKESSSSDFTSDSEDIGAIFDVKRSSGKDEDPMAISPSRDSNQQKSKHGGKKQSLNSELLSILDSDNGKDGAVFVPGKRNVERLDYKKLHDETYGNATSDSSDDEEWNDIGAPRKSGKGTGEVHPLLSNGNSPVVKNGKSPEDLRQNLEATEHTPKRRTCREFNFEDMSPSKPHGRSPVSGSSGKSSTYRKLGETVTQRLHQSFKENQLPNRATKETLAKELGLTVKQVSKWFENARWSFRHSPRMDARIAENNSKANTPTPKANKTPPKQGPGKVTRFSPPNGAHNQESSKAGTAGRSSELDNQEKRSGQSKTRNSPRKRKLDHQASTPESRTEETQELPAELPKAQETQMSGRVQTRRRKSSS